MGIAVLNKRIVGLVAAIILTLAFAGVVQAASYELNLTIVSQAGTEASPIESDDDSGDIQISDDGVWAVFESDAENLIAGDTNGDTDIYMKNLKTGEILRVSDGGTEAAPVESDGYSSDPSISSDGRYVAFESDASNLVSGVTAGETAVYVFDRVNHTMEHVSEAGTTASPVIANNESFNADISGNARYVSFVSYADNLIASDTNSAEDVFVFDRDTHTVERVSEAGTAASPIEHTYDECIGRTSISDDGRYVAFKLCDDVLAEDTNGQTDAHVFDRDTHTLKLASVGGTSASPIYSDGNSEEIRISGNGQFIVFRSDTDNLVSGITNGDDDIYVFDHINHELERVSVGGTAASPVEADDESDDPHISYDGRYVGFESDASNLISGDTNDEEDIFLFDRDTHTMERLSVGGTTASPVESDDNSDDIFITADACMIGFEADSDLLLDSDTNGDQDVFVVDGPNGPCAVEDNDGVDETIEDAAPNSGDANNDGTPDAEQATVTSLVNVATSEYSVLEATTCTANNSVSTSTEDEDINKNDDNYDYPAGLMAFTLTGCGVGGTETITQYHYGVDYESLDDLVLRKHDAADDSYTTVDSATFTEETIGGEVALKVVYQVTDGGPLDQDGTENGTIVDPAGPAIEVNELAETGSETITTPMVGIAIATITLAAAYFSRKQIAKVTKIHVRFE